MRNLLKFHVIVIGFTQMFIKKIRTIRIIKKKIILSYALNAIAVYDME